VNPLNLNAHSLEIAVLKVRADKLYALYDAARKRAEGSFGPARKAGVRQLTVALPDGREAGTLAIKKGDVRVDWDMPKLLQVIEASTPYEIEEYVDPAWLRDPRIVKVIKEHFADAVSRRVKPARLAELAEEVENTGGELLDLTTGAMVTVAAISRQDPTGEFAWLKNKTDVAAIQALLNDGVLTEDGKVARPAAVEAAAGPVAA